MRCPSGHENPPAATRCGQCNKALTPSMNIGRLLTDAGVAAALLLALLVVFLLDRGSATTEAPNPLKEQEPQDVVNPLRLAVTPPDFDDMGKLLRELGSGYRYTLIKFEDLLDAGRLSQYDVVFLTCSSRLPESWVSGPLRPGRRSAKWGTVRPEYARRIHDGLRAFVARGGTLYASDWQFVLMQIAFPEFIDNAKVAAGAAGQVQAEVVDLGLQKRLGPIITIEFDKEAWRPAALKSSGEYEVTTYLRGTYKISGGGEANGALLVQFPYGDGQVIFTSFHNEKQTSEIERKLLRYLVFTTVTAQTDAMVKRKMLEGGFSPVDRNLLSASSRDQSITEIYDNPVAGDLRFVLGFEGRGAALELIVVGPDGRVKGEQSGTKTIRIDVPDAAAGQWKYRITPLKVPYENFPFTLTVGEKQ